jgi:hypothetical protein
MALMGFTRNEMSRFEKHRLSKRKFRVDPRSVSWESGRKENVERNRESKASKLREPKKAQNAQMPNMPKMPKKYINLAVTVHAKLNLGVLF